MRLRWPGVNDDGTVLIELSAESFCLATRDIEVLGEIFTPKDELHVTLISGEIGLRIQKKIKQDKTIDSLLAKTFEEIDWSFGQAGPVHILSSATKKIIQQSIIMLVEMPGVTEFYDQLKALGLIEMTTPVPPAHVTMYTHNCPLGIGVPNQKTLNVLTRKKISVNALNKLAE